MLLYRKTFHWKFRFFWVLTTSLFGKWSLSLCRKNRFSTNGQSVPFGDVVYGRSLKKVREFTKFFKTIWLQLHQIWLFTAGFTWFWFEKKIFHTIIYTNNIYYQIRETHFLLHKNESGNLFHGHFSSHISETFPQNKK